MQAEYDEMKKNINGSDAYEFYKSEAVMNRRRRRQYKIKK